MTARVRFALVATLAGVAITTTLIASAHEKGAFHQVGECKKLKGDALQRECEACLKKDSFHFHPDAEPRCMPNEAKPAK